MGEKRRLLDRIVADCLGLEVHTTLSEPQAVPGEQVKLHRVATVHSSASVRWHGTELKPGDPAAYDETWTVPRNQPISQPYWLREDGTPGMFQVDDPTLIGRPQGPPVLNLEDRFLVGGQTLAVTEENGPRLEVIPPVYLRLGSPVQLFAPSKSHTVRVMVSGSRAGASGTIQLEAPPGWKVTPAVQPFHLDDAGSSAALTFSVTAPSHPESARLTARALVGGQSFSNKRIEINYKHIPRLLLQPPARIQAVCLDLAIAGHRVGYLPGAGDSTVASLKQMGYEVKTLSTADLTPAGLHGLDAVVVGVRAFNVRTDLAANLPALWAYVNDGGTVVEQYNTPKGLQCSLGPWNISLSSDLPAHRVTDEKSAVTLLAPDHPAFHTPNAITAADFDGWVQERGLDFPSEWDSQHLTALLACSDHGEAPLKSGLLVGKYGNGYFVYTGLSFFRQLPAGVPGAYRLFANLVSLGK